MGGTRDSERVDRRTLLVGSASFAAGGVFLSAREAAASLGESEWTPAIVAAQSAQDALYVFPLETDQRVRVELVPGAPVFADLSHGKSVMIEGVEATEGSISAQRIVQAVFGVRSDVER